MKTTNMKFQVEDGRSSSSGYASLTNYQSVTSDNHFEGRKTLQCYHTNQTRAPPIVAMVKDKLRDKGKNYSKVSHFYYIYPLFNLFLTTFLWLTFLIFQLGYFIKFK